jgi:hypothetical protein
MKKKLFIGVTVALTLMAGIGIVSAADVKGITSEMINTRTMDKRSHLPPRLLTLTGVCICLFVHLVKQPANMWIGTNSAAALR